MHGFGVCRPRQRTKLVVPLHPDPKEIVAQGRKSHLIILTTSHGRPFTPAGLGGWMADKIAAARLPDECVTHRLRKAATWRPADAGCTTLQIMAVTGHKSLQEVERCTRETGRSARAATRKLTRRQANKDSQTT